MAFHMEQAFTATGLSETLLLEAFVIFKNMIVNSQVLTSSHLVSILRGSVAIRCGRAPQLNTRNGKTHHNTC